MKNAYPKIAEDLVATASAVRPSPTQASSAPDGDGDAIAVYVKVALAEKTSTVRSKSKRLPVTTVPSESTKSTAKWSFPADDADEKMPAVNSLKKAREASAQMRISPWNVCR